MGSLVVAADTFVTLSYTLFDERGEAVDRATESDPLTYVHGYAQIVPGLERGLTGLSAGDGREIIVEPNEAFGDHDDEGVFEVEKADFPDSADVSAGDEFVAEGPDGEPIAMRVVEVLPDAFVVDTNHPLAGQRLRFEVKVAAVRAANEEEIASAQAELEERAHEGCDHEHGEGHDHDHDHAHGADHHHHGDKLVSISKKQP